MRKVAQMASKCGAMSIEHNVNAAAAAAAAAQHDVDGFVIKHPKSNALAHTPAYTHTETDKHAQLQLCYFWSDRRRAVCDAAGAGDGQYESKMFL